MVTLESFSNPCLRLIKVEKKCVSYLEKFLPRGRVSYKKERETRQMLEEGRYKKTGGERGENRASPYNLTCEKNISFTQVWTTHLCLKISKGSH